MSEEKKDSDVFNYLLSRKINDYEKKYMYVCKIGREKIIYFVDFYKTTRVMIISLLYCFSFFSTTA